MYDAGQLVVVQAEVLEAHSEAAPLVADAWPDEEHSEVLEAQARAVPPVARALESCEHTDV